MKVALHHHGPATTPEEVNRVVHPSEAMHLRSLLCLLYTSDAADERSSVDLGGRRIIKKKNNTER